jgi:uncharacterized protein YjbI with pentapeptide repeats
MSNNIPSFAELKESFARVYDGPSDLQREFDLVKEAQRLNIPLENYRNLYQHKTDEDIDPYPKSKNWRKMPGDWARWIIYLPKKKKLSLLRKGVFKLVESGIIITVAVALGNYIWEAPKREKQKHYQAWQMINSAAELPGSAGRIEALQDLNRDGVDLNGLKAANANLSNIDMKKARLYKVELEGANLQRANLKEASFRGANLKNADLFMSNLPKTDMGPFFDNWEQRDNWHVAPMTLTNLEGANLRGANLEGANLDRAILKGAFLDKAIPEYTPSDPGKIENKTEETNLKGANLINANLQDANLEGADLEGATFSKDTNLQNANIQGANFRGVKNLTVKQVKIAKNWNQAHYDEDFRKQLDLR